MSKVRRGAEILLVIWLFAVAADYAGLIELPGYVADLAALTLIILVGSMIWKYLIRRDKAHG